MVNYVLLVTNFLNARDNLANARAEYSTVKDANKEKTLTLDDLQREDRLSQEIDKYITTLDELEQTLLGILPIGRDVLCPQHGVILHKVHTIHPGVGSYMTLTIREVV